jgi:hypothetical protein
MIASSIHSANGADTTSGPVKGMTQAVNVRALCTPVPLLVERLNGVDGAAKRIFYPDKNFLLRGFTIFAPLYEDIYDAAKRKISSDQL